MLELREGQKIFSVVTPMPSLLSTFFFKGGDKLLDCATSQEGFVGVHPAAPNIVFFYDCRANATKARNVLEFRGYKCGVNICEFTIAKDGVPEMTEEIPEEFRRGKR